MLTLPYSIAFAFKFKNAVAVVTTRGPSCTLVIEFSCLSLADAASLCFNN